MCKTTTGTQTAASPDAVRTARRTPGGGGGPPPEPVNAFHGKSERVPEVAFVRERAGDGFLTSAKTYYELFGIDVAPVDSIEQIVLQVANNTTVFQRFLIVSHAHPRGMIIPFFTNGVKGTNKEIFREFAKSDLDGLKLLSPFEAAIRHLFNWNSILSQLMTLLRTANAAALQPFGLQSSGNPTGDLLEFMKFAFDIVYLRNPGRVLRNTSETGGLTAGQRTILENFVGEILNQMRPGLVSSLSVTAGQVDALRSAITSLTYSQLSVGDFHPHLGLDDNKINDFPTLQAVVTAIHNEFRTKLNAARTKITASTVIDIRGCRAGDDPDYIEAICEFFGTGAQKPMVTAPRHFQSYPKIAFQPPATRAHITSWLSGSNWGHTSAQMKQKFTDWAELIRVRPLHYDFWLTLFRGLATKFGALAWRGEIPALFIPTPGLAQLTGLDLAGVIGKLKDYFNVPAAQVPSGSVLTGLAPVTNNLATWLPRLLPPAADSMSSADRATLFTNLNQIDTALGQTLVPDISPNAPSPPTAVQLRGYQNALLNHLETSRLAPIKNFMTAAADSLETGDGLHYYMLFAGLPVFVHGTPELNKNGLVLLDAHKGPALQSWYKCLWKDPLPSSGPYTTASIGNINHRQVAALVGEDRTSYVGICPIPKYTHCIRKRPMPPDEDESLC
jgi:hypothetical protein